MNALPNFSTKMGGEETSLRINGVASLLVNAQFNTIGAIHRSRSRKQKLRPQVKRITTLRVDDMRDYNCGVTSEIWIIPTWQRTMKIGKRIRKNQQLFSRTNSSGPK
ncbi:hypothetical protein AVEN_74649-1 [Araneus ventricosus]|uniref:Uncharacterized protein n=1 Tax=Araneus ventricosus TaxID=182803 RepID=A0A4Y2EYJ1_ARAVE|nr:hypothetical protein AVEN_74649-1 [Araneus ventricosus]